MWQICQIMGGIAINVIDALVCVVLGSEKPPFSGVIYILHGHGYTSNGQGSGTGRKWEMHDIRYQHPLPLMIVPERRMLSENQAFTYGAYA